MRADPGVDLRRRLSAVAEVLRRHDDFAVMGHVDPDLDSVGSVLALTAALQLLGKRAVAVSPDAPPAAWSFLPGFDRLRVGEAAPFSVQVAVVVDTEVTEKRLGRAWPLARAAQLRVNLDHHDTNPASAEVAVVEPSAAATGEIVYHLVRELEVPLAAEVAVPLYAAILTDTGSFRFSNTRAETFRIAAALVEAGVDPAEVASRVYDTRPWAYMRLLGQLLAGMRRTEDGRVAWMELTREMAEGSGLSGGELEGLVQYPRMVDGVEVALLFKEMGPRQTRVSLRSQRYVDVAALARQFGGGGHLRSAGCTVPLPLQEAVQQVVEAVSRAARLRPTPARPPVPPPAQAEGQPAPAPASRDGAAGAADGAAGSAGGEGRP